MFFEVSLFVYLPVYLKKILKSFGQILMTFYGKIVTMAQGKDDLILVMIWITIWIQEFRIFFIIALISKIGAVGTWLRPVLSKCFCCIWFQGTL